MTTWFGTLGPSISGADGWISETLGPSRQGPEAIELKLPPNPKLKSSHFILHLLLPKSLKRSCLSDLVANTGANAPDFRKINLQSRFHIITKAGEAIFGALTSIRGAAPK